MPVPSPCAAASAPRGKPTFWISFPRPSISSSSAAGDAPASTCAVTQPNAVRGHFVFNFGSIVTFIAASACNRFQPDRDLLRGDRTLLFGEHAKMDLVRLAARRDSLDPEP